MRPVLWLGEPNLHQDMGNDLVITWGDFNLNCDTISVLDYVEQHAIQLRRKYLSFIHDMGQNKVWNKTLVEYLLDRRGYNLWWMSQIAEKTYLNSPQITDCIKLFALEEILEKYNIKEITVYYEKSYKITYKSIKLFCLNSNIKASFVAIPSNRDSIRSILKNIIHKVRPEFISVFRYFIYYILRYWKLFNNRTIDNFCTKNSIMFFSYSTNFDAKRCDHGEFYSGIWATLPSMLLKKGFSINFVHHYWSRDVKDIERIMSWIKNFNISLEQQGKHTLFENHISIGLLFATIYSYSLLYIKSLFIYNVQNLFIPKESKLNFLPLLKDDWLTSLRGGVAIRNCLFIEIVDDLLKKVPKQSIAFYPQENMYWERALLHGWRYHGHGKIVAVPLGTVNFWDMRFFDDYRSFYLENDKLSLPMPDKIALSDSISKHHFPDSYHLAGLFEEVEAVRYLYLNKLFKVKKNNYIAANNEDILILGDLVGSLTLEILSIIYDNFEGYNNISYTLKPHPRCKVNFSSYNKLGLSIITEQIENILPNYKLAIVVGGTSSAIDAYYSGVKITVYLGIDELNLSPLREFADTSFIRNKKQLKSVLDNIISLDKVGGANTNNIKYFHLDDRLIRWQKLILQYAKK